MRVAIVVRSGPAAGRRIQLKAGQLAKFGRSNWADFAFSDDAAMADVHFEIRCDTQACHIAALAQESPTLVNQQPITQAQLNSGDVILAGQTRFALDITRREPNSSRASPSGRNRSSSARPCSHGPVERYYFAYRMPL